MPFEINNYVRFFHSANIQPTATSTGVKWFFSVCASISKSDAHKQITWDLSKSHNFNWHIMLFTHFKNLFNILLVYFKSIGQQHQNW